MDKSIQIYRSGSTFSLLTGTLQMSPPVHVRAGQHTSRQAWARRRCCSPTPTTGGIATFRPRRLLARGDGSLEGYRTAVRGLQRICGQFRLGIMDLRHAQKHQALDESAEDTAATLADTARVVGVLVDLHSAEDLVKLDDVDSRVRQAQSCCLARSERAASEMTDRPRAWASAEALRTDLRRLVEECGRTHDELATFKDQSPGRAPHAHA